jgi:hypothetical protein
MVRTACIFTGGVLLGFVVLGGLITVSAGSRGFGVSQLLLLEAVTGATVGGFVGYLQKNRAGLMAILCLLPAILFQYVPTHRLHDPISGQGLFVLLLGTILELSAAFAAAYVLSRRILLRQA